MSLILPVSNIINRMDELPVPNIHRRRTDNCCTFIAVLISLPLFIYCLAVFNSDHILRVNFPSDSDGKVCALDYPAYPYVYFTDLADVSKRLCVRKCPTLKETRLSCRPTSKIGCFRKPPISLSQFRMYHTVTEPGRMGHFCLPKDEGVRHDLLIRSNLYQRAAFIESYDTILLSFGATISLGLVVALLVQCCPILMSYLGVLLGGMAAIILGAMVFIRNTQEFTSVKWLQTTISLGLIAIGTLALIALCLFRRFLRVGGVFLTHAAGLITHFPSILIYIIVLLFFTVGLAILTIFELLAVWSDLKPHFDSHRVFYIARGTYAVPLTILILVQLYWGLAFLREFFNFCIAGNAINFNFNCQTNCGVPFGRVIDYHFGSVVAASFMNGFLGPGSFLIDFIKPYNNMTAYGHYYYGLCGYLSSMFELARSDAMAYVNMVGLPYCNSATYCQFLAHNSRLYNSSQPICRYYRLGCHLLCISILGVLALLYHPNLSIYSLTFILIANYFIVTFFIDLHTCAAEGLNVVFLTEEYLTIGDFARVRTLSPDLINQALQASNIFYRQ